MSDPYDLERFVSGQNHNATYERAVEELRRGQKTSHWMWFIFPQIAGLGRSQMSKHYSISSLEEAGAYLLHPILGPRLIECAEITATINDRSADDIFGIVDAKKLWSSMTLFLRTDPELDVMQKVLDRFFDGMRDLDTEHLL